MCIKKTRYRRPFPCLITGGHSAGGFNPKKTSSINVISSTHQLINSNLIHVSLVGGIPTPLKNDGLRQLGFYEIPNWMEKSFLIPWFQSAPKQIRIEPYNVPILLTSPDLVRGSMRDFITSADKFVGHWRVFPWNETTLYPLVNIQKTMENHNFQWVNPL